MASASFLQPSGVVDSAFLFLFWALPLGACPCDRQGWTRLANRSPLLSSGARFGLLTETHIGDGKSSGTAALVFFGTVVLHTVCRMPHACTLILAVSRNFKCLSKHWREFGIKAHGWRRASSMCSLTESKVHRHNPAFLSHLCKPEAAAIREVSAHASITFQKVVRPQCPVYASDLRDAQAGRLPTAVP
jgi:hypothetical protein